ncbi:MAG TPA: hypothetical protein DEG17_10740 [Cyanobacteria bacterium UBA11149]|nr:hypothetical protein [Cyanobacteria bacterium UBA11367]HBE56236.1 hypothetical protein [Cyanobacteria bacterium UBA11366]HBK64651.1 hypothetical protein [Cyanobacteria bacterium UBA11166]HBR76215.1 hypothetical protein [Cyanobacteria bacterium UBA11159]HBS69966.1 hypothetical protein [Cyanobacteria bacterium UBA11153]HBW89325.1 hypothetical protein [Cyanobacteria bacterium UBA11149]HCA94233.1 hypothetical protein [Cyanobacteria bacterium UBA9226]
MKTDTIFYNLFQAFLRIFFKLINHEPEETAREQRTISSIPT